MPVMTKEKHKTIQRELSYRLSALHSALERRELNSAKEGAKGGYWVHPEDMCATTANEILLRLAVDDFKAILAEIRKLK